MPRREVAVQHLSQRPHDAVRNRNHGVRGRRHQAPSVSLILNSSILVGGDDEGTYRSRARAWPSAQVFHVVAERAAGRWSCKIRLGRLGGRGRYLAGFVQRKTSPQSANRLSCPAPRALPKARSAIRRRTRTSALTSATDNIRDSYRCDSNRRLRSWSSVGERRMLVELGCLRGGSFCGRRRAILRRLLRPRCGHGRARLRRLRCPGKPSGGQYNPDASIPEE